MKRMSLFAVAALLFAGAQLHAQGGTKQDSTKKAGVAAQKSGAKTADKSASTSSKMAAPAATKADAPAAGAAKKGKKGTSKKGAAKKDSTAKKP